MRKLLQSKAFVGALVVGAAITFVWPLLKPSLATPPVLADVALVAPGAPLSSDAGRTTALGSPWRLTLMNWQERFPVSNLRRDPFIQVRNVAVLVPATNPAPVIEPTLMLQAISMQPQRNLAVVNRAVLAEGDRVEGYRVESIQPTEVRLKQGERERILRFGLVKQSQRPPVAAVAPAASSNTNLAAPLTAQTDSSTRTR